jgi:hypothetical protein
MLLAPSFRRPFRHRVTSPSAPQCLPSESPTCRQLAFERGSQLHEAVDTLDDLQALYATAANVDDRAGTGRLAAAAAKGARHRARSRQTAGRRAWPVLPWWHAPSEGQHAVPACPAASRGPADSRDRRDRQAPSEQPGAIPALINEAPVRGRPVPEITGRWWS